jgi:hypothetical protein
MAGIGELRTRVNQRSPCPAINIRGAALQCLLEGSLYTNINKSGS